MIKPTLHWRMKGNNMWFMLSDIAVIDLALCAGLVNRTAVTMALASAIDTDRERMANVAVGALRRGGKKILRVEGA